MGNTIYLTMGLGELILEFCYYGIYDFMHITTFQ